MSNKREMAAEPEVVKLVAPTVKQADGEDNGVFTIILDDGRDARLTARLLRQLNSALDEVEAHAGPTALVLTGSNKFFSNGFDIDWLMGNEQALALQTLHQLLARLILFPVPTVCAINGHAFAGGMAGALSFRCFFIFMLHRLGNKIIRNRLLFSFFEGQWWPWRAIFV
mmetsp:Transcript_1762/g.3709  ORF Transcript_1762/g.3709 Transcript_1762/m.3709 type:complete len:169 (+) Transcript_1762:65-571(+)